MEREKIKFRFAVIVAVIGITILGYAMAESQEVFHEDRIAAGSVHMDDGYGMGMEEYFMGYPSSSCECKEEEEDVLARRVEEFLESANLATIQLDQFRAYFRALAAEGGVSDDDRILMGFYFRGITWKVDVLRAHTAFLHRKGYTPKLRRGSGGDEDLSAYPIPLPSTFGRMVLFDLLEEIDTTVDSAEFALDIVSRVMGERNAPISREADEQFGFLLSVLEELQTEMGDTEFLVREFLLPASVGRHEIPGGGAE